MTSITCIEVSLIIKQQKSNVILEQRDKQRDVQREGKRRGRNEYSLSEYFLPKHRFACDSRHTEHHDVRVNVMTSRQKLPSYGKVDITIYECTCYMLIFGGILLKFQQNTPFEMRSPINVEFIFCCVAF